MITSEVHIDERCSCGALVSVTGGKYRNDEDARNPRGAEEIVERWRADHRCSGAEEKEETCR